MKKPKIAVLLGIEKNDSDEEYLEAVEKTGGEPVAVRPGEKTDVKQIQGLVLTGGGDVDPALYGEKKEPCCDEPEPARDEFEISLLKQFLTEQKPVLAICRGIQVLNVALGGTLYQDLPDARGEHHRPDGAPREEKRALRHEVRVEKGSRLRKILGETNQANSRHHQAVKRLAPSLRAAARSADGVIEAVESAAHPWVIGVQWHPESREVFETFAPLFQEFIRACARGK